MNYYGIIIDKYYFDILFIFGNKGYRFTIIKNNIKYYYYNKEDIEYSKTTDRLLQNNYFIGIIKN